MSSGVQLATDSEDLLDMQTQLRLPTYADNISTTQPFTFTNSTTSPLWSHVDFVPEKIVDLSVTMDGLRFYKVQWHDSWVAEHQLLTHANVLQHFWSKQNGQNLPSNTNNSSAIRVTTACETTAYLSQRTCLDNLSNEYRTNNSTATKPAFVIDTSEGGQNSGTSISELSVTNNNNDLSGNESSEQGVDPTLASVAEKVDSGKCEGNANPGVSGKDFPPAQKMSDHMSSASKIDKVMLSQPKNQEGSGISVQCDGIEILGIKNTGATEAEIQEKARELVGSFKSKRRKFENGGTYSDRDTCFFCLKEVSNGKSLRLHLFNIHLKNFGHLACEVCQSKFFYNRELKIHIKSHSEERNIICKVCQMTFKVRSGLYKHMKTHEKQSNFRCDVCHKNFKVQADLKTHCLEEHKNQITKCNVCKQKLLSGNSVYMHSMRHSGTRDFECDQCGRRFKMKQHLTEHKAIHTSEMLTCPFCEKKMRAKTTLVTHIRRFHKEHSEQYYKGKHTCAVCKKEYKDKGAFDWHIRNVHGEETQKEDFDMEKSMESLEKKMNTVKRMKRIKRWRAINMSDEELSQLSHKIDKITNPESGDVRLRCKMCNQSFVLISVMLKHLQDHKNGKVKKVQVCKDCGVKFKNQFLLQQHRKMHIVPRKKTQQTPKPQLLAVEDIHENVEKITDTHGKVIFRCKICPKRTFQMVRALKKHLQQHENDQTNNNTAIKQGENLCGGSGKSFKVKKHLQLHQKISHPMSNACYDNSVKEDVDNQKILKINRKRKQHLPMKLNTTGKRSAALNANSMLRLQMEDVLCGDD